MGFYIQGQWQFMTASINTASATNITMSLNSQAGTIQMAKFIGDVSFYVTFDKTASSTTSFYVSASNIVEFEPLMTNQLSFIPVSVNGNVYITYFVNKQTPQNPQAF